MFQVKAKNVPKNIKGVERRNFDQGVWGYEVNELESEFALSCDEISKVNQCITMQQYLKNHR